MRETQQIKQFEESGDCSVSPAEPFDAIYCTILFVIGHAPSAKEINDDEGKMTMVAMGMGCNQISPFLVAMPQLNSVETIRMRW